MRVFLAAIAFACISTASLAATFNPQFFFTAYDQGNNGFGIADPTPSVFQKTDFALNFTVNPALLRGSVGAGTANRKATAFLFFDLGSIASVSNATLDFQNAGNFILNTSGFPATNPDIKVRAVAMPSSTSVSAVAGALASPGAASLTFSTQAPSGTLYDLDVTGLFNAALPLRNSGDIIALMFDIDVPFSSLPNDVANGGYGNILFSRFQLDATEGAAPSATLSAVPLPAGLPLLLIGLGGFAVMRRRAR